MRQQTDPGCCLCNYFYWNECSALYPGRYLDIGHVHINSNSGNIWNRLKACTPCVLPHDGIRISHPLNYIFCSCLGKQYRTQQGYKREHALDTEHGLSNAFEQEERTQNVGKLGFVGLGIMGAPMAGHLIAGGHSVALHSRSGVPAELTQAGGTACDSPRAVAEKADIIFLMVPDTPHVEAVLFGENGVAEGLTKGKTVVDMSSISPIATKRFAKRINDLGCEYLDAPVSGED